MAKTKVKISLKDMTASELMVEAKRLNREVAKLRLEKSVGKLKNLKSVFFARKNLAKTLTVLKTKLIV